MRFEWMDLVLTVVLYMLLATIEGLLGFEITVLMVCAAMLTGFIKLITGE